MRTPPKTLATVAAVALSAAALATAAWGARTSALPTPPPPPGTGLPSGQCIRSHDIRNHVIADDRTLLLSVNGRDTYRVTVDGNCLAGAWDTDPIVTREPPGASIICKPIDMDLGIHRNGFTSRCIVDSIVKLTPQEVAALPKKKRP
ncbi:MAG: hypothetical protein JF588_00685 [Caulobacterales bacterium]|nr:hypothetical protein [Caulobacterales bacterium]